MRSSAFPPAGMLMIEGSGCEKCIRAVGRLRRQRAGRDRVRVAAPVQQEVLVLHVGETFRVEGHADKVEVRVEAVNLDGILDVVVPSSRRRRYRRTSAGCPA